MTEEIQDFMRPEERAKWAQEHADAVVRGLFHARLETGVMMDILNVIAARVAAMGGKPSYISAAEIAKITGITRKRLYPYLHILRNTSIFTATPGQKGYQIEMRMYQILNILSTYLFMSGYGNRYRKNV